MEASALEQGHQEKTVVSRNARREQAKIMMVVGPLTLMLMLGIWIMAGPDIYIFLAIPTGLYMFFRGWKTLRAEDETGGPTR